MTVSTSSLTLLTRRILAAFGCNEEEADIVATHLVGANLAGHDSHGVGMLPMYGEQIETGNLIPNQSIAIVSDQGAVTVVDGQRGFGHRIALRALDHVLPRVADLGVAVLGLRNSGHISRTGHYAEYCAAHGFISVHFVNVTGHAPLVAPFGAREPGFSTNPVSIAMPVQRQAVPLLDMATSKIAFGKARVASNKGESVPEGCLIDAMGRMTTDPDPMAQRREGALTAFGEHKGSGLGIFAELLAGALLGEHTVATAPVLPAGVVNGLLSIIIDPGHFDDPQNVERRILEFNQSISNKQPADGTSEVLLPGEPEAHSRAKRLQDGIPLDPQTLNDIIETGVAHGLNRAELENLVQ